MKELRHGTATSHVAIVHFSSRRQSAKVTPLSELQGAREARLFMERRNSVNKGE